MDNKEDNGDMTMGEAVWNACRHYNGMSNDAEESGEENEYFSDMAVRLLALLVLTNHISLPDDPGNRVTPDSYQEGTGELEFHKDGLLNDINWKEGPPIPPMPQDHSLKQ